MINKNNISHNFEKQKSIKEKNNNKTPLENAKNLGDRIIIW